mgnify:CR=1 FL=1
MLLWENFPPLDKWGDREIDREIDGEKEEERERERERGDERDLLRTAGSGSHKQA